MKKHVPNTLTSLNLFSGCIASVIALQGDISMLPWALALIIIAAVFDFFDGFAARLLKAYSPIGKELDSLADCVSFGFAPSAIVFRVLQENVATISFNSYVIEYLPYIAFLLAVFSALRLAKFNVDERQTESFIGLNTPANALFWSSFCSGIVTRSLAGEMVISSGLVYTIIVGIFVFSFLMVSELPMFSLKVKSLRLKDNLQRYFLALFILVLIPLIGYLSIAAGILLYIALSLGNMRFQEEKDN